jgi:UDP-glucose 4-epimerase
MQKILVTGGAGFIGSHLVCRLLEDKREVRVLDNFATGKKQNLSPVEKDIELVEGDLRDLAVCQRACQQVDTVFHLGALGSVPRSIDDPGTSNAVNVVGTLNLLVAAREAGVRRFVFSSSSSVYGDTPTLPKHEAMRPSPRSPYAVTKLAGEEYCRAFHLTYGLETVALRYFNVFGPRQDPNSAYAAAIPRFLKAISSGERPVIFGDGQQSRDFTYVDNVVEANLLAASALGAAGQVLNVACGQQLTIEQVVFGIASLLNVPCEPNYQPVRAGDVQHSRADIAQAQTLLGYQPGVLFDEGLKRTVAAYKQDPVR